MVFQKTRQKLKRAFRPTPMKVLYTGFLFVTLLLGAHMGFDYYNQNTLQYNLATCQFQKKAVAKRCVDAQFVAQRAIYQCSSELKVCSKYVGFYHQCCKDRSEGKKFSYKSITELYEMRNK